MRSADEERELDGWEDERLLALATEEQRIMITFNVKDFARLATERAAAGTPHAGILLIVGVDHGEFGLTLRIIDHALATRPEQEAWAGYAAWGTRARP